jgi:hypothetical protein
MNYLEAKAAVLADHSLVALETDYPDTSAPFRLSCGTDFGRIERNGYVQTERSYDLFRQVHQYTVDEVDEKDFPYHEAREIRRQLGESVECEFAGSYNELTTSGKVWAIVPCYTFRRTELKKFDLALKNNELGFMLDHIPSAVKPGKWKLTAEWVSE